MINLIINLISRILYRIYVNNTALNLSITTNRSDIVKLKLGNPNLSDGENN